MATDWPAWAGVLFVGLVFIELVRLDIMFLRALKQEPTIADQAGGKETVDSPLISVIVPAKDEEVHVEGTVRSLLASDYPSLQILVVDDRSADHTREIVERLTQEDSRVQLIPITTLPPGWTGKTHAMSQAADRASGEILLFTDADTVFESRAISQSVKFFLSRDLDMLSLLPGFTKRGFCEDAVYIHMALGLSYFYPLHDVNDQTSPAALASGCFIMMKSQTYQGIGTWARFRNEVTEDIAMSKAVKAEGKKLLVLRASQMVRTRPFDRIRDVCLFWKRTFYGGLEKSIAKIMRLCTNYIALALLFALLVMSGAAWITGGARAPIAVLFVFAALDMAAVLMPLAVLIRMERGYWPYSLATPFGVLVGAWICITTIVTILADRGICWRGSKYR
jgi:cellulose synthase/poly-beta-1,6-N-acetylglucosamine synthase-like glycosyltransferase